MKKTIILLAALAAFLLIGCTSPLLPGGGGMSGTNDNGTVQFSWSSPGQANNSRSSSSRNVVATGNNIQDAKKVVISIEAADGTVIHNQKQLTLFNFNGSFLSEPLSLKVGSYKLTEYLLLDTAGTVIYATPKEGSAKAHLVADPLPINFTVAKDAATNVKPEVVDAATITPDEFGYIGFDFVEAKFFDFLVSVMVYDAGTGSFTMTDAVLDVTTDTKGYSFNLAPATNKLSVNDLTGSYTLTLTKTGYETHRVSYTNAELKAFFQTPLTVVLSEKQPPADPVITFTDPNMESAVREVLRKATGEIHVSDVSTLTTFTAHMKSISNIKGLEHFSSLTNLNLTGNSIVDISPLAALTNLTTLTLNNNKVVDLSPLSSLTKLTTLQINNNYSIVDVSHLAPLTTLTTLHMANNLIVDISGFSTLTNLTSLHIHNNKIVDLTPLATLTKLTDLHLSGNQIVETAPLAGLTALQTLVLSENSISSIAPLAPLTNLTNFHFSYNSVSDISAVSGMTKLLELYFGYNNVSDLSPLTPLTTLKTIYLPDNKVVELTALLNNTGLGSGDSVYMQNNLLTTDARTVQAPALKARGVYVQF